MEQSNNNTPMPNPTYERILDATLVPVCNKGFTGLKDKATTKVYK